MITFGYNSRFSSPLRALLFVALGVLMIVAKADAMEIVVKLFAAFILAAGIVSVFVGFRQRKDGVMPLSFFNAATNVVIAVLLFAFSDFVAGFVSYLIGLLLFGFGLFQLFVLLSARSKVKVGVAAYVVPVVVAVIGAMIFFSPKFLGQSLGMIAGVALIIYGLSDLVSAFKVRSAMGQEDVPSAPEGKDGEIGAGPSVPSDAKEVDYEKVDEQ
jgi:hypothetical protein